MKKLSVFSRRCSMEALEDRRLMAGDVFARIERGNLIIRGDDGNNGVFVRAGFAPGEIIVLGTDVFGEGTRVNGQENTAVTLTGFNGRIEFTMNSGADRIRIQDLPTSRGIVADLGRGSEGRFELIGHTANGDISVKSREGNDLVTFENVTVNGSLTVELGDGANTVRTTGGSVGRDAKFLTGRDADAFDLLSTEFVGTLFASLGDGQNGFSGTNLQANRVEYKGGKNADSFYLEAGDLNWVTVDVGQGDNKVDLHGARINRDLCVTSGSGNDEVIGDENTLGGNAKIELGDGNNRLQFLMDVKGEFAIRGGRGTDDVTLDGRFNSTPIVYRSLKVELGDGANTLNAMEVSVRGKTEFKGGKNEDQVKWTTAALDSFFADLGGGTNLLRFTQSSIGRDAKFSSGDGNDRYEFSSVGFGGKLAVDMGDGQDLINMNGSVQGSAVVKGGGGDDYFELVCLFRQNLLMDGGGGNNRLNLFGSNAEQDVEIRAGSGNDEIRVEDGVIRGKLNIDAGDGANLVHVLAQRYSELVVKAGRGGDTVRIDNEFLGGGPASMIRSVRVDAGGGTNSFALQNITVSGKAEFKGGDGNDTCQIISSTVTGDTRVDLGNGSNSLNMRYCEFRGDTTIQGDRGTDSSFVNQLHVFKSLKWDFGDGANNIFIINGNVEGRAEFEGGDGIDVFELVFSNFARLSAAMGKSNDELRLTEVSTTQLARFDGEDGRDSFLVGLNFTNNFAALDRKSFEIIGTYPIT